MSGSFSVPSKKSESPTKSDSNASPPASPIPALKFEETKPSESLLFGFEHSFTDDKTNFSKIASQYHDAPETKTLAELLSTIATKNKPKTPKPNSLLYSGIIQARNKTIDSYFLTMLKIGKFENPLVVLCLIYIDRLLRATKDTFNLENGKPLLLMGLLLADKTLEDKPWSSEDGGIIGTISQLSLAELESECLTLVDFDLHVSPEEYRECETIISKAIEEKKLPMDSVTKKPSTWFPFPILSKTPVLQQEEISLPVYNELGMKKLEGSGVKVGNKYISSDHYFPLLPQDDERYNHWLSLPAVDFKKLLQHADKIEPKSIEPFKQSMIALSDQHNKQDVLELLASEKKELKSQLVNTKTDIELKSLGSKLEKELKPPFKNRTYLLTQYLPYEQKLQNWNNLTDEDTALLLCIISQRNKNLLTASFLNLLLQRCINRDYPLTFITTVEKLREVKALIDPQSLLKQTLEEDSALILDKILSYPNDFKLDLNATIFSAQLLAIEYAACHMNLPLFQKLAKAGSIARPEKLGSLIKNTLSKSEPGQEFIISLCKNGILDSKLTDQYIIKLKHGVYWKSAYLPMTDENKIAQWKDLTPTQIDELFDYATRREEKNQSSVMTPHVFCYELCQHAITISHSALLKKVIPTIAFGKGGLALAAYHQGKHSLVRVITESDEDLRNVYHHSLTDIDKKFLNPILQKELGPSLDKEYCYYMPSYLPIKGNELNWRILTDEKAALLLCILKQRNPKLIPFEVISSFLLPRALDANPPHLLTMVTVLELLRKLPEKGYISFLLCHAIIRRLAPSVIEKILLYKNDFNIDTGYDEKTMQVSSSSDAQTALSLASENNPDPSIIDQLLKAGADPFRGNPSAAKNAIDHDTLSLLRTLRDHKADLKRPLPGEEKQSLALYALNRNRPEALKLLIGLGITYSDAANKPLVLHAVENKNRLECLDVLLEYKMDEKLPDPNVLYRQISVDHAADNFDIGLLQKIAKSGAPIDPGIIISIFLRRIEIESYESKSEHIKNFGYVVPSVESKNMIRQKNVSTLLQKLNLDSKQLNIDLNEGYFLNNKFRNPAVFEQKVITLLTESKVFDAKQIEQDSIQLKSARYWKSLYFPAIKNTDRWMKLPQDHLTELLDYTMQNEEKTNTTSAFYDKLATLAIADDNPFLLRKVIKHCVSFPRTSYRNSFTSLSPTSSNSHIIRQILSENVTERENLFAIRFMASFDEKTTESMRLFNTGSGSGKSQNPNSQILCVMERTFKNQATVLISSYGLCEAAGVNSDYSVEPTNIEVMMEWLKECVPTDRAIYQTWQYNVMLQITSVIQRSGSTVRKEIDDDNCARIWLSAEKTIPTEYVNPATQTMTVLLGVTTPSLLAQEFKLDSTLVKLVTARLLTVDQAKLLESEGLNGYKLLVERFTKDGSDHIAIPSSGLSSNSQSTMASAAFFPPSAPAAAKQAPTAAAQQAPGSTTATQKNQKGP